MAGNVQGNPFSGRAFCPVARKTVCFHLKGGLVTIFPVARGRGVPGNFSLGPSPNAAAGRRRPLHKITLLLVRPLWRAPGVPFSRPFFTATYVDEGLALWGVYGPYTLFPSSSLPPLPPFPYEETRFHWFYQRSKVSPLKDLTSCICYFFFLFFFFFFFRDFYQIENVRNERKILWKNDDREVLNFLDITRSTSTYLKSGNY